MRIWLAGPRIGWIRPGISFRINELFGSQYNRYNRQGAPTAATCVYVMRTAGHIKIGASDDPIERKAALQTGSPTPIDLLYAIPFGDAAYDVEAHAHRILDARRLNGEWFDATPAEALAAIYGAAARLNVSQVDAQSGKVDTGGGRFGFILIFMFWYVAFIATVFIAARIFSIWNPPDF